MLKSTSDASAEVRDSATRVKRAGQERSVILQALFTWMPVLVLVALVVIVSIKNPDFLSKRSLQALTVEAAPLLFLALGQTLVIMIGGIDLSVAALASFASVLLALWLPSLGLAAVLFVLMITTAAGGIQGYIHAKAQVPSFVVTLSGLGIFASAALMASGASTLPVTENLKWLNWMTGMLGPIPRDPLVAVVIVAVIAAGMRWLPIGRYILAIGNSEVAGLLSGIRATKVRIFVFGLSGLSAGLAATLLVAEIQSGAPSLLNALLLPTIAAVVVGGTAITGGSGGLARTMLGVLIISVLRVGIAVMGINPSYEQVVYGAVIIAAVSLTIDRSKIAIVK
jgi:ribose transport system permease protein